MKLFNRKDKSAPEEIQDYYAGEQRNRKGVALLLGAATLVVTLLLALGIFYGGRWAYRAIFDDGDNGVIPVANDDSVNEPLEPVPSPDDTGTDGQTGSDQSDGQGTTQDTDGQSTDGDSEGDSQPVSGANGSQNLPSSGALPATGPTEPEL